MIWTVHTKRCRWPCGSDRDMALSIAGTLRAKGWLAVVIGAPWERL